MKNIVKMLIFIRFFEIFYFFQCFIIKLFF